MKYLQKAVASVLAVALAAGLASCSVILIDPKDTQTAAGTVAVSGYAGGEAAGGGTSASAAPDSLPDGAEGRFSSDSSARLRLLLDYTRTAGTDGFAPSRAGASASVSSASRSAASSAKVDLVGRMAAPFCFLQG